MFDCYLESVCKSFMVIYPWSDEHARALLARALHLLCVQGIGGAAVALFGIQILMGVLRPKPV